MKAETILSQMKYSKNTAYDYELTFTGPDGYQISVVKSSEIATRKQLEETLIEQVQERYGAE